MEVLLVIIVVLLVLVISLYNKLVHLKIKTEEAWSEIDTQLKRRYDLIPNVVETVKGYAKHESSIFEEVTRARTAAMGAKSPVEQAQAENGLSGALKSLFAVAENYPELKANTNFLQLQTTLATIEDDIQKSRRFYNAVVRDFNTAIYTFPSNVIAGLFNFAKKDFFEIGEAEKENVKVQF